MNPGEQSLEKADAPLQDVMGWGKNHAAAYRCLVDKGPLEAGEVVVRTNIPRGRIYDVLEDLVEEGAVTYRERNPRRYDAQNPEGLIQERKENFDNKASELIETLGNAYQLNLPDGSDDSAWVLGGRSGTVRKLRELLEEAEDSVRALEPDPRWCETSDHRVYEKLHREDVELKPVIWSARQDTLEEIASFKYPVWEHGDLNKMFYVIDGKHVVFQMGGDTGVVFSDATIANVFAREFEEVFKNAEEFDLNDA